MRKEMTIMAKNSKNSGGRIWKNERASVNSRNKSRSKSNKYLPTADSSQHPKAGTASQYWRAGYTRKDGTHVKGHFVKNPHRK
jgi:hypothetical protein